MSDAAPFELFHRIADPGSARARRFVVERELKDAVRFRNLAYPEVEDDFTARGGRQAPALWDGRTLVEGADAVQARLAAYLDVGRGDA